MRRKRGREASTLVRSPAARHTGSSGRVLGIRFSSSGARRASRIPSCVQNDAPLSRCPPRGSNELPKSPFGPTFAGLFMASPLCL